MEMDAASAVDAVAATHPTTIECSIVDQVTQSSVQSTATAPIVLPRGKKEITPEARAAESKKRAARRVIAKQKEKDRKKQVPRGMSKGVGTRRSTCKASPTYKGGPLKSNKGSSILRR
jgi:hypothetical protein